MDDLKECPFCGAKPTINEYQTLITIECNPCGVSRAFKGALSGARTEPVATGSLQHRFTHPNEDYNRNACDEAIAAWNRRAVPQASAEQDALLEAAKEVVRDALDNVAVHPCDQHNAAIRAKGLFGSMLKLYEAIRAASKTTPSNGEGE